MSELPDWCCASGCKKCPAWKEQQEQKRCSNERKIIKHGPPVVDGRCERCERRRVSRQARRARLPIGQCRHCERSARPGRKTCDICTEKARVRRERTRAAYNARRNAAHISYVPIDVWLNSRRHRILRILRRFDWLSAEEISDELGIPSGREYPSTAEERRSRDATSVELQRLRAYGWIEHRQWSRSMPMEYRLSKSCPLSELEPPIDTAVLDEAA